MRMNRSFGYVMFMVGLGMLLISNLIPLSTVNWRKPVSASASSEAIWAGQAQLTGSASYSIDSNFTTSWTTNELPASITFKLDQNYTISAIRIEICGHTMGGIKFTLDGEAYTATGACTSIILKTPITSSSIMLTSIQPLYPGDWVEISEFSFIGMPLGTTIPTAPPPPQQQYQLVQILGLASTGIGLLLIFTGRRKRGG